MSIRDYTKSSFFKIWCEQTDYFYVDHSISVTKKVWYHKNKCIHNHPSEPYLTINRNGGWDNWKIEGLDSPEFDTITDVKRHLKSISYSTVKSKTTAENCGLDAGSPQDTAGLPQDTADFCGTVLDNSTPYTCKYCDKQYTRMDSVTRHQRNCKMKLQTIDNNQLKLRIEQLELKYAEQLELKFEDMKKQLMQTLNKECKMHPKTLNKLNNTILANHSNISTNTTNTNSNNSITPTGKKFGTLCVPEFLFVGD
jgi:hypothetical protein